MASIGTLVANLGVNTKAFEAGIKRAKLIATDFKDKFSAIGTRIVIAGAAGLAGAGVLLKYAADAETLAVQFRVLTGSADKAAKVIASIQAFAAETPFESMEIGNAAKQLIAFGFSAENVVSELRMLGDLASGLSIPLGDIAEIYGKAKNQGRLFAEDINQLQGRGIPVMRELAKQFGVTEAEVKKMVESGKVGFPDVQKAFESMTGSGGAFNGMMQQISQTTAGKFSTLVDNVKLLATAIGKILLPVANMLIDWALSFAREMEMFGKVAQVVASNMRLTFVAMLETLRGYAGGTFDFIVSAAVTMAQNIAISVQNIFAALNQQLQQMGEEIAYLLGLSDQVMQIPAQGRQNLLSMPQFKSPALGPAGQELARLLEPVFANGANDFGLQIGDVAAGVIPGNGEQQMKSEKSLTGAMLKGSQEAYSAIAQAMNGSKDPVVAATKEQTQLLLKPLSQIAAGFGNMGGAILVNNLMGPQ